MKKLTLIKITILIAASIALASYGMLLSCDSSTEAQIAAVLAAQSIVDGGDECGLAFIPDKTSAVCIGCHKEVTTDFFKMGHPYMLRKIIDGQTPMVQPCTTQVPELPDQVSSWAQIGFYFAGFMSPFSANFMDLEGWRINSDWPNCFEVSGNIADPPCEPYVCASCHTTGYNGAAVNPLPGIIGDWDEEGVQCVECHTGALAHAAATSPEQNKPLVDSSAAACGRCHIQVYSDYRSLLGFRGPPPVVVIARPWNLLQIGKHRDFDCVICHDPHVSVTYFHEEAIVRPCTDCHDRERQNKIRAHLDIDCEHCHMPGGYHIFKYKLDAVVSDLSTPWLLPSCGASSDFSGAGDTEMVCQDDTGAIDNGDTGVLDQPFINVNVGLAGVWMCVECHESATPTWVGTNGVDMHVE